MSKKLICNWWDLRENNNGKHELVKCSNVAEGYKYCALQDSNVCYEHACRCNKKEITND